MRAGHAAWLFAAPALAVIGIFFFLPVLGALLVSLTDFDLYALADLRNLRFVGLGNYWHLLHAPEFWRAVGNTVYFVLVGVPLSLGASLAMALLINSRLTLAPAFYRTVFFAPVVATLVAVALLWLSLLHPRYGLLNYALAQIGIHPIDWLGDPHWALPAIILFAVWKNFGYNMVIFIAALQSIPADLYEAARLDGAGLWQEFSRITLPMLRPTLLLVSVLRVAGYFQLFAEPYVMTRGGPLQSTVSVLYYMYEQGFKWWDLGSASAVAFLLFLMILAVTALHVRLARGAELR